MIKSNNLGKVITFYSYKGGVGRTMSLVNIGVLLAQKGHNVLMIDWDLEAPGLERYIEPYLISSAKNKAGLIEFLIESSNQLPDMQADEEDEDALNMVFNKIDASIIPIEKNKSWGGVLSFLRAGNVEDRSYAKKIMTFNWEQFFTRIPNFFLLFSYYLKEKYDYILIDSRTGHTDAGGVCTMLMPDALVLAFIPNSQNLEGVLNMVEIATDYRKNSGDLRPLRIFPMASRIEMQEKKEREYWARKYTQSFEEVFQKVYDLSELTLSNYFQTPIQQSTYYAFGEKIAVLDETIKNSLSLTQSYNSFVERLLSDEPIWEYKKSRIPTHNLKYAVNVVQIYAIADTPLEDEFDKYIKPLKSKVSWKDIALSSYTDEKDLRTIRISLESADLIILMISSDYLSLDIASLIQEIIIKQKASHNFAIILRPCLWDLILSRDSFTILPEDEIPVVIHDNNDVIFNKIAIGLNSHIDSIIKIKQQNGK